MIATDSCTASLAPLQSCTLELTFQSLPGLHTASLAVSATPGSAVTAALSGMAFGEQLLTSSPSVWNYGLVVTGQPSVQTFMITNQGGLPAMVSTQIGGADATQFMIVGIDTCTGATLAGGTSCSITIAFSPTASGMKMATFTATQPAGAAVSVLLQGSAALANPIVVSPGIGDYGDVVVGQSSMQTFTITNPGGSPLMLSTQITGTDPTQFIIGTDTCNGTNLAPTATCTITIAFSPTSTGLKVASVSVASVTGTGQSLLRGNATP